MNNENVVGAVVMAFCSFGCGVLFFCIGNFASGAKKPFGFWAGSTVPMEKVTDLHAYNHANAVMWKIYSIPYWLSGIFGLLGFWSEGFILASAVVMCAACFPGIFFLISHYRKIEKRYIRN